MRRLKTKYWGGQALPVSDYITVRVLAATTSETHAVPTGANAVRVKSSVDAAITWIQFVALVGTAVAIPAADITDGTGPILVQKGFDQIFEVPEGLPFIACIASAITTVTFEWFTT
jgi:hypothetical protein